MRGELRLLERGDNATEVQLEGRYRPPFGVLGVIVDVLVGHRVAQRTADATVERLATQLEAAVSEHIRMARGHEPHGPPDC